MINIAEMMYDPDFSQGYTVHRKTVIWTAGKPIETTVDYDYIGVVVASDFKEIQQVPEADRVSGMMSFYSTGQFFLSRTFDTQGYDSDKKDGTSDQIEWRGNKYKVIQVLPFVDYGYWECIAARIEGE